MGTDTGGPLDTAAPIDPHRRRQEQRAWYFYDWAASAFSTTVITVFLGPYLTNVTEAAADERGFVHPFGVAIRAGSFFPYVISASVLLSVLLFPLVGAIADRTQAKRELLGGSAFLGSLATMGLYFVGGDRYLLGGLLLIVANVAFGVSIIVYNGYLPEIALPEERDAVSARGWAMGYLGGLLLLVLNLVLFLGHETFGLSQADAVRISLFSAGAWWALFTLVPLAGLRRHRGAPPVAPGSSVVRAGFSQLAETVREARGYPRTLWFLGAFLLYNEGVQTVISQASVYGAEELGLDPTSLLIAIIMVQVLAFGGSLALARVAARHGAKRTILGSLAVWMVAVALGYVLPAGQPTAFFALAGLIGFVLGGTQALSRSLFSQMIPAGRETQYFSLYEISDRGTSWLGPLLFGLAFQFTGSYRVSIVALLVFFGLGFVALWAVPVAAAVREAGNPVPKRL